MYTVDVMVNVFLVYSTCDSGKWWCSENHCPARCLIEGQFVTTLDGKQFVVPGKCTYVASQVIPPAPKQFPSTHLVFL